MELSVSVQDKKNFLQWFMQTYRIESHEMEWFLEELIIDDRILDYVHFVERIEDCPKGIIMTKGQSETFTFTFFKGNVSTEDVYTAYHEIHLYQQENLFIQVNFPENEYHAFYQAVLEADEAFQQYAKETTEELLEGILLDAKINDLKAKVNHALEVGNKEAFMAYSRQLQSIQKME